MIVGSYKLKTKMNLNLLKLSALLCILVVESKGGLVGGVYERIKNTTSGLTKDVKNAWTYSKSLVVPETGEQKEQERGLIGGMLHSAHERIHYLHEELWKVEEIPNDSGLLWNMYNRLKQRLEKAKHFILGDGNKLSEVTTESPNPEATLIKETMEKLFNPDGTRKIAEDAFNEAVEKLKQQITELRKNAEVKVEDGEGLIDVRMSEVQEDLNDNLADTIVGNKVAKGNLQNQANDGVVSITNGWNKAKDGVNGLYDKARDEAAKERNLLEASYNKLSQEAKNVADGVKNLMAL